MERQQGKYVVSRVGDEEYQAYIPTPLPPKPPVDLDNSLIERLEKANRALGRLDNMADSLPNIELFLYQYVRKEALLSSQIEGTQSSYADLLLYELNEAPGVPIDDTEEVSNYIAAMQHGLARMRDGFPLCLRLICEIHKILLQGARGTHKQPGEFRRSQNWLGGSRPGNAVFVPPPPEHLMSCLNAFEAYIHDKNSMPVLVKAALLHVQFETIHPFLDGNGRVGRLLITLLLCEQKILTKPLLYLSLYFKVHRSEYYAHLQNVRKKGDWESWIHFFLQGVDETAQQAVQTANAIQTLFAEDSESIKTLGRIKGSCQQVHQQLQEKVIINIQQTSKALDISRNTVSKCLTHLQALGVVREITGYRRNRLFIYDKYVQILSQDAEPF